MTQQLTVIAANRLAIGMYVQRISGQHTDKFPADGKLLQTDEDLHQVRIHCKAATVDLTRSSDRIQKIWSFGDADMRVVEEIDLSSGSEQFNLKGATKYRQRDFEQDKYGYRGRFVYRALEEQVHLFIEGEEIDLLRLDRSIQDVIAYTAINPDLLHLESNLSERGQTMAGIVLRALVHIATFGAAHAKNENYVHTMAYNLIVFAALFHKLPTHMARHFYHFKTSAQQTTSNGDALFAQAIQKQFNDLSEDYKFPMSVKKNINHMCERFDGQGPLGLEGHKLSQSAQINTIAFMFELLQSRRFNVMPINAIDALAHLRRLSGSVLNPKIVEPVLQQLPLFPTGSMMQMEDNQLALVTDQHPLRKLQPSLLAVTDKVGQALSAAKWISSEVKLGGMKQKITGSQASHYAELIRKELELVMPWYKKILHPAARVRDWIGERMDRTG